MKGINWTIYHDIERILKSYRRINNKTILFSYNTREKPAKCYICKKTIHKDFPSLRCSYESENSEPTTKNACHICGLKKLKKSIDTRESVLEGDKATLQKLNIEIKKRSGLMNAVKL